MRKFFSMVGMALVLGAMAAMLTAPPAYGVSHDVVPEPPPVDDNNVDGAAPSSTMPRIPRIETLPGVNLGGVEHGDSVFDYLINRFIPRVIRGFLVFIAMSALLFTIISGVQFVLSMGNTEKAALARKSLSYALIGLTIALLSFAIVSVINRLGSVLGALPPGIFVEEAFAANPAEPPIEPPVPSPIDGRVRDLFPPQDKLFGEGDASPRLIGDSNEDLLIDIAPRIVKVILALGGAVVFVIFVVAGVRLVIAQGTEEELEEVKRTFIYSAIGLAIIVSAYAFVFGIVRIFSNF